MTREYTATEQRQKEHYDSVAEKYAAHYGDPWSLAYRRRFMNDPMLGPVDLRGKTVLDAICGSGESTGYLLGKGAVVTGLDISEKEMARFSELWPGCTARCASVLDTGLPDDSFDCVVVVAGLHHVHPFVEDAVKEIHRVLKPGGYFCFCEPHRGSLPDMLRRLWYRFDGFFAENEESVDLDGLKGTFADRFEFCMERYAGNVAFLFVLQSLVWRIPLRLKKYYAPALLRLEALIEKVQGKRLGSIVTCRWRKK